MERKRVDMWGKRVSAGQNSKVFNKSFGSEGESINSTEAKLWLLSALTRLQLQDKGVVVPLHAGSAWRCGWLGGLHRPHQVSHQLWEDRKSDTGGGHPAGVGQGDAATYTQPSSAGRCSAPICLHGHAVPSAAHRSGGGRKQKMVLPLHEGLVLSPAIAGSEGQPKLQAYAMGKKSDLEKSDVQVRFELFDLNPSLCMVQSYTDTF